MPCNGFSFAVRVACQINFICRFCSGFQIGKIFAASFIFFVLRLKIVFNIHTERAFGQVADMPHGGFHHELRTQDLADGFDFCW